MKFNLSLQVLQEESPKGPRGQMRFKDKQAYLKLAFQQYLNNVAMFFHFPLVYIVVGWKSNLEKAAPVHF